MCKGYITHSGSLDAEFIAALVKKEKPIQDAKPERKRSSGIDELPSSRPILGGGKKRQRRESEILDTPPSSPKPTTAAEPTPISDPGPEEEATIPAPTSAPTPTPTDRIINPWERQWVEPTRPPLPPHFSSGSFKISFKVTQQMSPSCRMIVYYIRGKETVADSTELDTEDVFANKVSGLTKVSWVSYAQQNFAQVRKIETRSKKHDFSNP